MKNIKNDKIGLIGVYNITKAKISNKSQIKLCKKIDKLRKSGKDFMPFVYELNRICDTETIKLKNIIPTVGRTMIANNLVSTTPTNEMIVEYIALGTDNTTPANGDTTLGTETYRNSVASKTNSDNVAYVSGFFNATETTGTFYEAGIFSDATSATDSGILLSRVLLDAPTGIVKSNTETLTIDWTITIN